MIAQIFCEPSDTPSQSHGGLARTVYYVLRIGSTDVARRFERYRWDTSFNVDKHKWPSDLVAMRDAINAALAASPPTAVEPVATDTWLTGDKLTPEQAWTILCETPDITSPEEYPNHALITLEQLSGFMERAASTDLRTAVEPVAWTYCPGCGSQDNVGMRCNACGQDWQSVGTTASPPTAVKPVARTYCPNHGAPHVCINRVEPHHPDDLAVDRFAAEMKAKLAKKRDLGYGGWEDPEKCSGEYLSRLLHEHVRKGDPLDVGNIAMMLHQRGLGIGKDTVFEGLREEAKANAIKYLVIKNSDVGKLYGQVIKLEGLLENPPNHKSWGAGETDCPDDIKAPNGELHTLRCKICGKDNPRSPICLGAIEKGGE